MESSLEADDKINNSFYEQYGQRWYTAYDDPVALLRAENKIKFPWIMEHLKNNLKHGDKILDVGCGGGFLSNALAEKKYKGTGIDISRESLGVAKAYDVTDSVEYVHADAFDLPFESGSFDAITAMDFLEHVEYPDAAIKEISRVLRPEGLFFFHTFNRNPLSHLVIIKLVEWFIKNTPKNMHVIDLFIRPREMELYCRRSNLYIMEMTGIRPRFSSIDWKMIKTGVVSPNMEFVLTNGTLLSYLGVARKVLS